MQYVFFLMSANFGISVIGLGAQSIVPTRYVIVGKTRTKTNINTTRNTTHLADGF